MIVDERYADNSLPYQQPQRTVEEDMQRAAMAQQLNQSGNVPVRDHSPEFMQWLFNFREEVLSPLEHNWKGEGMDGLGRWVPNPQKSMHVMNENGITWAKSYIGSFINPVYVVSNYDEKHMNWTMRTVGKVVWDNLACRYKEFGMRKLDISRVASEIISAITAILLGARGNGYRDFFTKTTHISEVKSMQQNQQRQGFFSRFKPNIFDKNNY